MLEGKKLSFRYKKQPPVFEDVSFSLPEGEVLSIMGPNGAGKSTLLKCINRIHRPASGGIAFDGTDVYRMSRREIGRLFGYVPQDVGGGLDVSVVEAVMLGRTPYIRIRPTQEDREIVFGAIERLGLEEYAFRSLSVVMIIHDLSLAYRYSDRVLMMRRRMPSIEGPKDEVITCDSVRDVYQVQVQVKSGEEYPFINPLRVASEAQKA